MKKIKLTRDKYALVDDEDYEYLNQWKWYYSDTGYAMRTQYLGGGRNHKRTENIRMHRVINNTPDGMFTDHINMSKVDNRKINLRNCTKSQNGMNRDKNCNNKSGYKGVSWSKNRNKWEACISTNGVKRFLGYHDTPEKASNRYNREAKLLFKEFSR